MGWAAGSDIYKEVAYVVDRQDIHKQVQALILSTLAYQLSDCDWDTFDECWGINGVSDAVLDTVFGPFEDEDTD